MVEFGYCPEHLAIWLFTPYFSQKNDKYDCDILEVTPVSVGDAILSNPEMYRKKFEFDINFSPKHPKLFLSGNQEGQKRTVSRRVKMDNKTKQKNRKT